MSLANIDTVNMFERKNNHHRPLPVERQSLETGPSAVRSANALSECDSQPAPVAVPVPALGPTVLSTPFFVLGGLVVAASFVWAYWPTLVSLVATWNREPDYSHGFFVVPLAVYFLWTRRDRFPGLAPFSALSWIGLGLVAASVAARAFGAHFYLDAIDGWSILLWVGGVVWFLAGWRVLWWSAPSIVFLWFMVPLPFRMERWLSLPLQGAATKLSCWMLQALGQPALAEGHVIFLGDYRLEVEQACSGLRIFVGILALAFAYVVVTRRTWWEKTLLLLSAVPIALLANSIRIVATGLLYQYVSGEVAKKFSHDGAGWVMILLAAGMFGLVLWYLSRLVREVECVGVGDVVRRERVGAAVLRPPQH